MIATNISGTSNLTKKGKHLSSANSHVLMANENAFVPIISSKEFSIVTNRLRFFFMEKGYVEVHTQNRLSIMAACEDPDTISTYDYCGNIWPLPQTGQMWLEHELLNNPDVPGFFCVSTSYRNEPHPVKGRHHRIFPMFEFELHGGMDKLMEISAELLEYLGFGKKGEFPGGDYEAVAKDYGVSLLEREHETQLGEEFGPVFFLKNFPERTSPFWNMKRNETDANISNKVDVLLHGMETIGSAERSCDPAAQREAFLTIENGAYAQKLYDLFGKERVLAELDDFLAQDFFPRSGGGIGITRMMRAMKLSNLI